MRLEHVLTEEMNWTWMLLSFPFGILAQMFRGWRWKQTLDPIEDLSPSTAKQAPSNQKIRARSATCIHAVFISYAASLIIPRIGEFSRCAVLKRFDGVSFSKALGTVVTERAVDTLIVLLYSGVILLIEMSVFGTFFQKTGTSLDYILEGFSLTGWLVTAICGIAVLILLHLLLKNFSIYNKVKMTMSGIWEGVLSLRGIKNLPLYLFFSIGIWVMYFLHYYLTFFCFDFTANLGIGCALVSFVVANFASRRCSSSMAWLMNRPSGLCSSFIPSRRCLSSPWVSMPGLHCLFRRYEGAGVRRCGGTRIDNFVIKAI